ncbi:DUF6271 family protein [Kitasatospora terrestris]|uniref:Condensation domain-containing protein n=1 Tax=Kitasatospora terrestris TaxID=258051 RepID=A0ABP9DEF3_9ACTN
MRRICLTLPTDRACVPALLALAEEAAHGAREFGVEVELLVLDSSPAPVAAGHAAALAALPPVPGVRVHHLDEDAQRSFLARAAARAGLAEPERLLGLLLPDAVSYGACTDRAFLFAEALGCSSVHRRDSDSRYQLLYGTPVFPLHQELSALGLPAAEVAGRIGGGRRLERIRPGAGQLPVALVGASFIGELSVDVAEIQELDPAVHAELVGLSLPPSTPALWRGQAIREAFRGAGTEPFTADRAALGQVAPNRVDMCNVALGREVYGRIPLPPAVDTIGTDYFLLHVVHHARLPGVLHNRHIVNFHTGERRTASGHTAYHLRLARFLLLSGRLAHLYDALAALTDPLDAGPVASAVREAADGPSGDGERLATIEGCYRRLGGAFDRVADALAERRKELLDGARADLRDFADLIDAWAPLTAAVRSEGRTLVPTKAPRTRTVPVRWQGGEPRRGPLTLGQANMIRCILRDGAADVDIHDVWPVPAGASTDAVLAALRTLTVRHEALRTVFPQPGGTAPTEQLVLTEGEFEVTVTDFDTLPADPGRYADELARAVRRAPFDLGRDHPLRAALLTERGTPTHLALVAGHAAADGSALAVLREEWTDLLTGRELAPLGDTLTPIALAEEESAPAGRRKAEASVRYWEKVLRTGPQAMFAEPRARTAGGPAAELTLRSARGGAALARASARLGVPASTVLLTAWCALVAHRAGQRAYVGAAPTANRWKAQLARAVTPLSQDALILLDTTASGFDELLGSAWSAALNAYRHSRFDARLLWETIDRTTVERGSRFARDVVFNDVSGLPGALRPAAATAQAAPGLELAWGDEQDLPTALLAFVYRTDPLLHLALRPDPQLFDRREAEGFLTGLVRLLEAAADGDVPLAELTAVTGVRTAERGADWQLVDGCWVSPAATAAALSDALDGRPVHVTADLTAYLAGGPTPARAHAALMRILPGRPGVLAPRRYLIVPETPAEPGLPQAWLQQPTLTEGTGRPQADPR